MIGKRIAKLRKKMGLSQVELANYIGISRSSLSLYEIEKREPDGETLTRFANYFRVSTDYLLGRIDNDIEETKPESKLKFNSARSLSEVDFLENVGKIIFEQLSTQGPSDGGWDVDEMAKYFQIDKNVLDDIFSGTLWPPLEFLENVSLLCEVSTDYLLGLTTNKRHTLDNGQCPFRFNHISKERLKQCMEEYDENLGLWSHILGISNTELYLLQEYGYIFHLQILEIICATLNVSADYLLNISNSKLSIKSSKEYDEDGILTDFRKLRDPYRKKVNGILAEELLQQERDDFMRMSSVAADEKYIDSQGKSQPSSGTGGDTIAV